MTKLLGSWDPGILCVLELLGVELPLGVVGLAVEFVPKVCSGRQPRQTGRNLCHWSDGVPGCLGPADYSQCWGRCCVLLTSDLDVSLNYMKLEGSPDLCAAAAAPRPPRSAFPAAVCGVDAGGFQGMMHLWPWT